MIELVLFASLSSHFLQALSEVSLLLVFPYACLPCFSVMQIGSQHECLIQSLRGRNDTVYRIIIVARQIINTAVIYVVSSIRHNDRSRRIGQNIVSGANCNIAPWPLHCRVSTRTFNSCTTPRAFKCHPPSGSSFCTCNEAGKNHDCCYEQNCNNENSSAWFNRHSPFALRKIFILQL